SWVVALLAGMTKRVAASARRRVRMVRRMNDHLESVECGEEAAADTVADVALAISEVPLGLEGLDHLRRRPTFGVVNGVRGVDRPTRAVSEGLHRHGEALDARGGQQAAPEVGSLPLDLDADVLGDGDDEDVGGAAVGGLGDDRDAGELLHDLLRFWRQRSTAP